MYYYSFSFIKHIWKEHTSQADSFKHSRCSTVESDRCSPPCVQFFDGVDIVCRNLHLKKQLHDSTPFYPLECLQLKLFSMSENIEYLFMPYPHGCEVRQHYKYSTFYIVHSTSYKHFFCVESNSFSVALWLTCFEGVIRYGWLLDKTKPLVLA